MCDSQFKKVISVELKALTFHSYRDRAYGVAMI